MIGDVVFDDEILIIVKTTIDKLIYTVNNVKELIEHLYTAFVDNPDAQAILPELIVNAEAYRGLNDEDFERGINDDDPEALKIQIQLRDKIKKKRQKSEKN